MNKNSLLSNRRIAIVAILFGLTFVLLQTTQSVRDIPIKRPLQEFPRKIGKWEFMRSGKLSDGAIHLLKVDDYLEYDYGSTNGPPVNLYVSYFKNVGVSGGYHSPRNCLPGSGWDVASIRPMEIQVHRSGTTPVKINRMIVQKGSEKQVTLYWYQNRGRIIASEYWEKFYLVLDSLSKGRRDGSFIRIMAPATQGRIEDTTLELKDFAEQVIPILEDFLPGK